MWGADGQDPDRRGQRDEPGHAVAPAHPPRLSRSSSPSTAQRASQLAKAEDPDLILMDMSLPVVDGWEATRRLKADAATWRSRSSGSPRMRWRAIVKRSCRPGCDDYDTKPVELPRLLQKIEALLARTGGRS